MINPKVLFQVKDESAAGAGVTHYRLNEMEVCAPATWEPAAVSAFAEFKVTCMSGHRWEVSAEPEPCHFEPAFAHFQLYAVKVEKPTIRVVPEPNTPSSQPSNTLHVNTIINISGVVAAAELDRTAESFELLTQWLRAKALAAHERNAQNATLAAQYDHEAETLNNKLLAQFRGALVLI